MLFVYLLRTNLKCRVGFGCFNDVRPSVNPIEPLESVDFYSMNISYIEKSIF